MAEANGMAATETVAAPATALGLPPRPKPAAAVADEAAAAGQAASTGAAAAAVAAGEAEKVAAATAPAGPLPAAAGGSGAAVQQPVNGADGTSYDQPFTFTSPFDAAAQLRQGQPGSDPQAAAVPPGQQQLEGGGERRPSGVLRYSGSAGGNRLRRSVSWPDIQNNAPLTQVVEYEPSEGRSTRSEDEWGTKSSACSCCIQ